MCGNLGVGPEALDGLGSCGSLALPHMAAPEQELAVEVADLDRVQIHLMTPVSLRYSQASCTNWPIGSLAKQNHVSDVASASSLMPSPSIYANLQIGFRCPQQEQEQSSEGSARNPMWHMTSRQGHFAGEHSRIWSPLTYHSDVFEASEDQCLEQLAADAPCSNRKNLGSPHLPRRSSSQLPRDGRKQYSSEGQSIMTLCGAGVDAALRICSGGCCYAQEGPPLLCRCQ